MRRKERAVDWRGKVNPLFALAIEYLRVIPRFVRALATGGPQRVQAHAILVDACNQSLSLFPPTVPNQSDTPEDLTEWPPVKENKLLADPAVRQAIGEVATRVRNIPGPLLKKGFGGPHWWMTQKSWQEFVQESHVAESLLNMLSLVQLHMPLRDLTQRVADGDSDLYGKLFLSNNQAQLEGFTFDAVIRPLTDEATKIVGRALLLKGQPPGHQLSLRMMLFFGWEFGLSDLSIPELHAFLVRMDIIPANYDPEALRKYRDRMRRFINTVSSRQLPSPRPTSIDVA